MEICGIMALALFIITVVLMLSFFIGEEEENVSECFLKFKELGCSLVEPTDECKKYLECLRKYGEDQNKDEYFSFSYIKGILTGFVGFVMRYYIKKVLT